MPVGKLVPATAAARAESAGRLPFAFGRRFFLFLAIGLVWIAPAWREPRFLYAMAVWDLLAIILWAWDLGSLPRPKQIEVRRIWSKPVGLAQQATVTIELRNESRTSIIARVDDGAPQAFSRSLTTLEITALRNSVKRAAYSVEPRSRGDVTFGSAWLRYQSPLRLAERWARARIEQTIRVYPDLESAQKLRIYLIRSRQIELEKRLKRLRGYGREFESLRDYREGDEARDICWSATARRGKPITKVHQVERSQTIWIVLDAGRLLQAHVGRLTKLDYTVNAALSLAQVAFYSGDRVALLAYGRRPQQRVGAGRGMPHLRVLLESLSQVRAEPFEADHFLAAELVLSLQSRRSLIVWLTDLAETAATPEAIECAARMATRHLVLLGVIGQNDIRELTGTEPANLGEMYRYTAALEIVQRRDLLLRRLRQQGALTMEVDPRHMSTELVNRYLEVKERSLL
jgi:uncharacterized protein (DUF58 family)